MVWYDCREELEVKFRNSRIKSQSLDEGSRFYPVVNGSPLKIFSRKVTGCCFGKVTLGGKCKLDYRRASLDAGGVIQELFK